MNTKQIKEVVQARREKDSHSPGLKSSEEVSEDVSEETQVEIANEPESVVNNQSELVEKSEPTLEVSEAYIEEKSKPGRPATGKRSKPEWVGRTFYIRRQTDFDVKKQLFELEVAGVQMDKSELVDKLLSEWVETQKSKNS